MGALLLCCRVRHPGGQGGFCFVTVNRDGQTTCPSRMRRSRAAVSGLFFVNGFVVASWIPYIPMVKSRHDIGDGQLGFMLLSMVVGGVLALPLAGWLVGRFGSRLVAAATAAGLSLMFPGPVFAPSVALASLALLVFGALNGALDVSMNAQAVDVERHGGRPIMSSFHALFSLGGLAGAAVAGLAMVEHVPPVAHVVLVSMSMVTVVVLAAPSLMVPAPGVASPGGVFARPSQKLLGLGLLAVCGLLAEGAMADWSAVYLSGVLATSSGTAAFGFAAFSLAMAGGRFAGDALTRRWGAVRVLRASSAFASVGLTLALLLHDARAAVIGFGAVGLGIANIVPLVFGAAGRAGGVHAGTTLAAVATLGYFGWLAGPPIIGMVSEALGLSAALGVVSVACAFVAIRAHVVSETPRDAVATRAPGARGAAGTITERSTASRRSARWSW